MPEQATEPPGRHLTEDEVRDYTTRRLPPDRVLAVLEHITTCEDCSLRLETALLREGTAQRFIQNILETPPLPFEHLEAAALSAYVMNRVDPVEREMIKDHLSECAACRVEVEQARLRTALGSVPEPVPFGRRVLKWLGLSGWRSALTAGVLALAVGLIVFFISHRPAVSPASYAARERELEARLHKVTAETQTLKVEQAKMHQEARTAQGRADELDHRQKNEIANAKLQIDQANNALAAERAKLAALENPHGAPGPLPDPRQLAAVPVGDGAFLFNGNAGGGKDPLPFPLLSPVPGATVRADNILFRWGVVRQPADEGGAAAQSYIVEITGQDGTPWQGPPVKQPWWKPSAHDLRLQGHSILPGHRYSWRVLAFSDEQHLHSLGQSPQGDMAGIRFRTAILDAGHFETAEASPLRLGIALAQAHLLDEARTVLESDLISNPRDGQAEAWLKRVISLQDEQSRRADKRLEAYPDSAGATEMRAALGVRMKEEKTP